MKAYDSSEQLHADLHGIVSQVQAGDTDAYTYIITHFQRKIYLYGYYLLGSRQEAEDAAQDIFIKGLTSISRFTPTVSFSAWLYKIAHHHCIDLLKKRKKSWNFFMSYRKDSMADYSSRYTDYIQDLLELLNEDERKILLLRSLEQYSFQEIGLIMELKPAAVRKKYERLRKKLIQKKGGLSYEHVIKHGG